MIEFCAKPTESGCQSTKHSFFEASLGIPFEVLNLLSWMFQTELLFNNDVHFYIQLSVNRSWAKLFFFSISSIQSALEEAKPPLTSALHSSYQCLFPLPFKDHTVCIWTCERLL